MGIIYGYGSTAAEVAVVLNGSLTSNRAQKITSLKLQVDPTTDYNTEALGSLYAIAIVEQDENYNGRNTIFSATGSEFAHFLVQIAAAYDSNYGVSEVALTAVGSDNGSLLFLECLGVSTGLQGNASPVTANSVNVEDTMGSIVGSADDLTRLTCIDMTTLGSITGVVKNVYAIAFSTTKP